jgi:hypothetical protein
MECRDLICKTDVTYRSNAGKEERIIQNVTCLFLSSISQTGQSTFFSNYLVCFSLRGLICGRVPLQMSAESISYAVSEGRRARNGFVCKLLPGTDGLPSALSYDVANREAMSSLYIGERFWELRLNGITL